ncbi:acyl-CoA dehydrogenase [Azospirillum sp. RWY-5-1]|uniref:Acyl-CoA dehydrogenase n=1 Tax=Azospirillum oleiclasticum TaxID=2735135 RepID=A0ABX2TKU2_9PROT|nr:acyl-CoA dehydrogenase family protein [Azospirillum oleiclasticum]NYZ14393.1 acyl-CoA dehydrogenase [Azospirillum oleiclasticum]NYZ23255.1 acyl-CoA dehydrogenase [Azospirillum oleiclasticum]
MTNIQEQSPTLGPSLLPLGEEALRTEARRVARSLLADGARERDRLRAVAHREIAELGKAGFMGLLVPTEFGGRGCSLLGYCLALEEIAAVDAGVSTSVHVHSLGATLMIARFGTQAQKSSLLPTMATGACIGSFLLTEPQAGSDSSALRTTARRDGGHFVLDGTKHLITNGKSAGTVLVWAVTDPAKGRKGITAFIVPTGTPGYAATRVEAKMGQHSSETVEVTLSGCRVPADHILGEEGDGYRLALAGLADGRIAIAAQSVGIARAAFEAALAYAQQRTAYGQPIARLQAVTFHLADMAMQIEVARTFYIHACRLQAAGHAAIKEAAMAKLFASEMAEKVCSAALQVHGGNGYLADHDVERYSRDARATQIYEGTSDIQRVIIGKELLQSKN